MTVLLRVTGFLGLALFSALLAIVFWNPKAFERSALSFIKGEVASEVMDRYPDLADRPVEDAVQESLGRLPDRIGIRRDDVEQLAASKFPEVIGRIVEGFCSCDPVHSEGAAARSAAIRAALEARANALVLDQERITEFMQEQYTETVDALRADLMIFLLVNAVAFAAVLGATFVPPDRRHAVVLPAGLLVLATATSAAIYLMGTDWFYTILFRDYAGWWYGLGLLIVFAFLVDIVLNHAKVTLRILSNLPSVLVVPTC